MRGLMHFVTSGCVLHRNDQAVYFSRHALNQMRMRRWSAHQVASLLASEDGWISAMRRGKIKRVCMLDGEQVTIVLAADTPDFVVTIHGERGPRR